MEDLKRAVLLGTERTNLPEAIDAIEAIGIPIISEDDAATLLNAITVYTQASKVIPLNGSYGGEMPVALADEKAHFLSRLSTVHLNKILTDNNYKKMLPEFAHHVYENGLYIPPELLPVIFDWCLKDKKIADSLSPILGETGKWLARYNKRWQAVIPTESSWTSKDIKKQLAYFRELRKQKPDEARQILEASMGEIEVKKLGKFVELLAINLSPKDESFLEKCLEISTLKPPAILLLKKNREYKYAHRWIARAKEAVKWDGKTIQITPPAEVEEQLVTDISLKTKEIIGNYDALVFSHTPPDFWEKTMHLSPDEILHVFAQTKLHSSLFENVIAAVTEATIHYRNENWAISILSYHQETEKLSKKTLRQLTEILSKNALNNFAVQLIKADSRVKHIKDKALSFFSRKKRKKTEKEQLFEKESFLTNLLVESPQSWGRELTILISDKLISYWNDDRKWQKYNAGIRQIISTAHPKIDPMYYHDDLIPTDTPGYADRFLELFFEQWKFRKEMIQTIEKIGK